MKTITQEDLEELVSICRNAANGLAEQGSRLKAAAIHELADVAADQHRAECERLAPAQDVAAALDKIPVSPPPPEEEKHRHVWGEGLYEGKCVVVPGCTAKPRKKKEAATVAGEGSL